MLEIQKFIKENENWEELLSKEPYFIKISRKNNLILFNYTQGYSTPCEIVNECRGLILEDKTWKVIRYGFYRFYNYQENGAAAIDWQNVKCYEKMDGTLILICFYNNEWHVSTRNTFDLDSSPSRDSCNKNFKELFDIAAAKSNFSFEKLNPIYTYCFELISPFNQIIIKYDETKLYHLLTRNNKTLKEIELYIGVEKPKTYNLTSIEEVLIENKENFENREGFVVCDQNYNRIKVKTEQYFNLHALVNNHVLTTKRALALIFDDGAQEFISYFPQYEEDFNRIKKKMGEIEKHLIKIQEEVSLLKNNNLNKKDLSLLIKDKTSKERSFYFMAFEDRLLNWYKSLDYMSYNRFFFE